MALFEVVEFASILPFMSVVLDPLIIENNKYLQNVYSYLNYEKYRTFSVPFRILVLLIACFV